MTEYLISSLQKLEGVTIFSKPNASGIVSFKLNSISPQECAERLSDEFDVAVRAGFHCAPLMHEYLKTQTEGLIRVSLATQNTYREITFFARALKQILLS